MKNEDLMKIREQAIQSAVWTMRFVPAKRKELQALAAEGDDFAKRALKVYEEEYGH